MKPIIGVLPLWDDEKNSIWMLPAYMNAISEEGGVAIILPLKGERDDILQICKLCDGFLFTGGHDVSPSLYGEEATPKCGLPNAERDDLERVVFEYALIHDTPILGICRGIQLINALCGGSLYQDLPSEYDDPRAVNHQMTPPYHHPQHRVSIVEGSPLHQIVGTSSLEVNSYHHQAIKSLGVGVIAAAISEDGLVEAIDIPHKKFILAVQWHPEFSFETDHISRQIFRAFIEASSSRLANS